MRAIRLVLLLGLTPFFLAIAACHHQKTQGSSGPEARPGLSVSNGRLVLPAVPGNPGAAYFTIANTGDKPVRLAAVDIAGAGMAMLHETKAADGHSTMAEVKEPEVMPGESLRFAPGGKHVMVFDPPPSAMPGGTIEMTITFADGDKISTPLEIRSAGQSAGAEP